MLLRMITSKLDKVELLNSAVFCNCIYLDYTNVLNDAYKYYLFIIKCTIYLPESI